jgi:2-dehydro-3-deoxygluconokinase
MTPAVLTLGETMTCVRLDGPLRLGGAAAVTVAGSESNVAIGLARLGHHVRWAGRVGDDEPGQLVLRTLRAEGIDLDVALVAPGERTGLMVTERAPGGPTRVQYYRAGSAGSRLSADDVLPAVTAGLGILHVTGVTAALGESARGALAAAVGAARRVGAQVSLDVNHRPSLWDDATARAVLRELVPHVDILVASEDELPLVADGPDEDAMATHLLARGVREVVVKRGHRGAGLRTRELSLDVPARSVPVVNVVGAGDAFTAGYLSGVLDGLDPEARLRRGAALGACAVTSPGDWEGLPTRRDLAALELPEGSTVR